MAQSTPKHLLNALDLVTTPALAEAEALGGAATRHYERVRSAFEDPNIVGAGIARKVSEGKTFDDLSLVFYVRRKKAPSKLARNYLVPPVMAAANGQAIYTDVVEIGDVKPQKKNAAQPPLRSGFSVGHFNITAGTLGAVVLRGKTPFILSNSHVLADSGVGSVGDDVLFPGPADGGAAPAGKVAELSHFTPFETGGAFVNTIDAALAKILNAHLPATMPPIWGASTPIEIADPVRDMRVKKRGRTTGDTTSVVRDTDFRIQVNYPGVGVVGFTGQVLCDTYTKGGDSGSVVVDADTGAVVGLHFAGSANGSIFTPIKTVMKALKFRFA